MEQNGAGPHGPISVFLADDNLIVREGVRALINARKDLNVVGVAADFDELVSGAEATRPQVLVTDIRMPPTFTREGIDAAREVRKRHPGTGVVVLSQYDDPEYAVSLLAEGSAGYGYLLKDRVAEGSQLVDAIRVVATGGTALDPAIVEALVAPVVPDGGLLPAEEELLGMVAEGKTIKAIAAAHRVPPEAVAAEVDAVFVKLAQGVSAGNDSALRRLRQLHQAIVDREEQGETLSRLLPSGLAKKLRQERRDIGETERVTVTVLMSDIRSYSAIAEHADPSQLAGQLNTHRAAMNQAILGEAGTVMQFVGDAVMAVFGAPFPQPDHPDRAVAAALGMHALQAEINGRWRADGLPPFGLGWGFRPARRRPRCSGRPSGWNTRWWGTRQPVPALAAAEPGETVLSEATFEALRTGAAAALGAGGSRDATLRCAPTRSTGWGMMSEAVRAGRARRAQDLRGRERAGPGGAGGEPDRRGGRLRRPDGPSGCGKSTLLNLVAGLTRRTREITVAGAGDRASEDDLARMRRRHGPGLPVLQPARGHDRAGERGPARGHRAASARWRRPGPGTCSTCSASATRPRPSPACCPAASGRGRHRPRPGQRPTCCWPTADRALDSEGGTR